jgi:hypothetical protein
MSERLRCVACRLTVELPTELAATVRAVTGWDGEECIDGVGIAGWFVFWDGNKFNAVCPVDLARGMPSTRPTGEIVQVATSEKC